MRGSRTVLQVLGAFCASGALAAELDQTDLKAPQFVPTTPYWSVVGSVSPTYTENALFSRDNPRRDFFYEPDVSLRLDGSLAPDLSYRIFARAQYEAFATATLGHAGDLPLSMKTDMISTASSAMLHSLPTMSAARLPATSSLAM